MAANDVDTGAPRTRMPPTGPAIRDVDYNQLDQNKVVVYGIGVFTGITTALFPLSVIKTRQMASPTARPGFSGAFQTAVNIKNADGLRGFYRGFGTVVAGAIPARILYLPTYEATRTWLRNELYRSFGDALPDTAIASISNGAGGAMGSVASSAVVVPMDVISSRLMVVKQGGSAAAATHSAPAVAAARSGVGARAAVPMAAQGRGVDGGARSMHVAARDSVARGVLERAAPRSAATTAQQHGRSCLHSAAARATQAAASTSAPPQLAAAVARGARHCASGPALGPGSQAALNGVTMAQLIVKQEGVRGLYRGLGMSLLTYTPSSAAWWGFYALYQDWNWAALHARGADVADGDRAAIAGVQAVSGCMAGLTSGVLTTPLDVIKTQLQVAGRSPVTARLTTLQVVQRLHAREGLRGFWRGATPRMANAALWGTCMVSAYEFLKRVCVIEEGDAAPA